MRSPPWLFPLAELTRAEWRVRRESPGPGPLRGFGGHGARGLPLPGASRRALSGPAAHLERGAHRALFSDPRVLPRGADDGPARPADEREPAGPPDRGDADSPAGWSRA